MPRSRYNKTKILDNKFLESFSLKQQNSRFNDLTIFNNIEYTEYVVKNGDRLDTLAAKFLNDDTYWWVLALFNGIRMPIITPGQKIRIPKSSSEVIDRL